MVGSFWRALFGLALLCSFSLESKAEQIEYYDSSVRRVAVAVLSYEDQWLSYAGEAFYAWMLQNRFDQKYKHLWIVRGKKMSAASIQRAMQKALKTGLVVDVFLSVHSRAAGFDISGGEIEVTPEEVFGPVVNGDNRWQLGLVVNVGCNNLSHADAWINEIGFKSYVGHKGTSVGALALNAFLDGWIGCETLSASVAQANSDLTETYTRYHAPAALFRKISGKKKYEAEMVGYGVEQQLCYRGQYRPFRGF